MRVLGRPAFATRYWNPYTWLLYKNLQSLGVQVDESTRRRVIAARHQILHIHWPEQHLNRRSRAYAFGRSFTLLAQLTWLRRRGTRIVWTVHNLAAHERFHPRFERWFWREFVRRLDGYICLTEASRAEALARFPELARLPGQVVPHGHYRGVYPNTISRASARTRLNISPGVSVILFLGAVREYKNVTKLIDTFRTIPDPDVLLLVAGKPTDDAIARDVHRHAAGDARVRPVLAHVPDDELQVYFAVADVVVLPYREILNSGSAIMSLSFNRPVLLPSSACGTELQAQVGAEWVRVYEGELNSRELMGALEWAATTPRPAEADLSALSWERVARLTAQLFEQVASGGAEKSSASTPVYEKRGGRG